SVAIDGDTALVAAEHTIDTSGGRGQSVYLFERDASGHWDYRSPLSEVPGLMVGSLVIEGNVAAVSGNVNGSSLLTVYERGSTGWAQTSVITLPRNGAAFRLTGGA